VVHVVVDAELGRHTRPSFELDLFDPSLRDGVCLPVRGHDPGHAETDVGVPLPVDRVVVLDGSGHGHQPQTPGVDSVPVATVECELRDGSSGRELKRKTFRKQQGGVGFDSEAGVHHQF